VFIYCDQNLVEIIKKANKAFEIAAKIKYSEVIVSYMIYIYIYI